MLVESVSGVFYSFRAARSSMGRVKHIQRKSTKPYHELRRETVVAVLRRHLPVEVARLIAMMDEEMTSPAIVQYMVSAPPLPEEDDEQSASFYITPPPSPPHPLPRPRQ